MKLITYIIKFKEVGREWSSTTYTCSEPVSEDFLADFFGLRRDDVEDFAIETKNENK